VATSENELEVMLNTGIGWNKGDGITHLMQAIEDNLDTGHLLICGSTHADLPMVQKAKLQNKTVKKINFSFYLTIY
jgi:hydroxymethylpyrimidine pyrophosphatase-like HAD family hydrolase